MIGRASCRGAVTIVNAIPTGFGSAVGITLQIDVEADLTPNTDGIRLLGTSEGGDLAEGCINAVARKQGIEKLGGIVKVDSDIPVSRGLKSSSAASNAMVLATSRAIEMELSDDEILGLAIDASMDAGVTVTGAFDDACACFHGGAVVTDNRARTILKRWRVPGPVRVLLHVPDRQIRKKDVKSLDFSPVRTQIDEAVRLALEGEIPGAMELNSKACAKVLDVSEEVADAARKAGALAAGVSGTGPSTAVLVRPEELPRLRKVLEAFEGTVITAELNDVPAREVSPRQS